MDADMTDAEVSFFEAVGGAETFRKLTEPPPNSPSSGGRRLRKGRPER